MFDVDDMIDELDDDICESVITITNNINTINISRTIHTFVSDDDDDDDDGDDGDDGDDDDGFFSIGGVVGGIYSNFEYVLEGCWYIILSGFEICFDIDVEYDDGVYV